MDSIYVSTILRNCYVGSLGRDITQVMRIGAPQSRDFFIFSPPEDGNKTHIRNVMTFM
jgi:hypothetical protein